MVIPGNNLPKDFLAFSACSSILTFSVNGLRFSVPVCFLSNNPFNLSTPVCSTLS